jgi:hypothetical protein
VQKTIKKPLRRRIRAWRHRIRDQRILDRAVASRDELVLLHQMGKVGSSSVRDALEAMEGIRVFQSHWWTRRNLQHKAGIIDESRRKSNRYGDRHHFGAMLYDRIVEPRLASRVVTMVRDPLARNVSSYFQHLDDIWGMRAAHERVSAENLIDGFHRVFEHDEPLTWFQTEIEDTTGIDVFASPFDTARRWTIIPSDHWSLLIMRTDLPDEGKQEALSTFLGVDMPPLPRSNVGSTKKYASQYRAFKQHLTIPRSLLDRLYNAPVTRHFFSPDEVATMRARWTEG